MSSGRLLTHLHKGLSLNAGSVEMGTVHYGSDCFGNVQYIRWGPEKSVPWKVLLHTKARLRGVPTDGAV